MPYTPTHPHTRTLAHVLSFSHSFSIYIGFGVGYIGIFWLVYVRVRARRFQSMLLKVHAGMFLKVRAYLFLSTIPYHILCVLLHL